MQVLKRCNLMNVIFHCRVTLLSQVLCCVRQASMDELKDQLLTQLFAGHETTGTAIGRWVQPLQRRPDVVAALPDEQAGLIAQHGPDITGAPLAA